MTSEYIWNMENVLTLYEQPYDPRHPVVCFDERPCQLIGDLLVPIPMKPGSSKKEHYEYVRNGTCCILIAFDLHYYYSEIQKYYQKAEQVYRDAIAAMPDHAHFYAHLADALYFQEKNGEALDDYSQALQMPDEAFENYSSSSMRDEVKEMIAACTS